MLFNFLLNHRNKLHVSPDVPVVKKAVKLLNTVGMWELHSGLDLASQFFTGFIGWQSEAPLVMSVHKLNEGKKEGRQGTSNERFY